MNNEEKVYKTVKKLGRAHTTAIAKKCKLSRSTASRYLHGLAKEGKVRKEELIPYIYWSIMEEEDG